MAPIVVFVVLGVIFKWHVFSWILFMILAVMLGVLFATMMLTKRADKVTTPRSKVVPVPQ